MLRRDCRHFLRYGGRHLCRHVWVDDIRAEPKELMLGCDSMGRCPHYASVDWKRQALPPAERQALEQDEETVLEWDDDEDSTKNELPPVSKK